MKDLLLLGGGILAGYLLYKHFNKGSVLGNAAPMQSAAPSNTVLFLDWGGRNRCPYGTRYDWMYGDCVADTRVSASTTSYAGAGRTQITSGGNLLSSIAPSAAAPTSTFVPSLTAQPASWSPQVAWQPNYQQPFYKENFKGQGNAYGRYK